MKKISNAPPVRGATNVNGRKEVKIISENIKRHVEAKQPYACRIGQQGSPVARVERNWFACSEVGPTMTSHYYVYLSEGEVKRMDTIPDDNDIYKLRVGLILDQLGSEVGEVYGYSDLNGKISRCFNDLKDERLLEESIHNVLSLMDVTRRSQVARYFDLTKNQDDEIEGLRKKLSDIVMRDPAMTLTELDRGVKVIKKAIQAVDEQLLKLSDPGKDMRQQYTKKADHAAKARAGSKAGRSVVMRYDALADKAARKLSGSGAAVCLVMRSPQSTRFSQPEEKRLQVE